MPEPRDSSIAAWEEFAADYPSLVTISETEFHLGPNGDPLNLDMPCLNLSPDTRALDLGCGNGSNARVLASRCAAVVGVDASEAQIAVARASAGPGNVSYVCDDAMSFLASAEPRSFDFACSVFAVEYIPALRDLFNALASVLTQGAAFLYCDLHPFASSADVVSATPEKFLETNSYFAEGPRSFQWPGDRSGGLFRRYHRTLHSLFAAGDHAGFRLVNLVEPQIGDRAEGPYQDESLLPQMPLWRAVPYTLCLVWEKT